MKRAIFLAGMLMVIWAGAAGADGEYISGRIERFAYDGYKKFIQVGEKQYLVNRHTQVDIMRGKELLSNVHLSKLRVGLQIKAQISSLNGESWAKKIEIIAEEPERPVKFGQMSVPVVAPEEKK